LDVPGLATEDVVKLVITESTVVTLNVSSVLCFPNATPLKLPFETEYAVNELLVDCDSTLRGDVCSEGSTDDFPRSRVELVDVKETFLRAILVTDVENGSSCLDIVLCSATGGVV